jgi:hypothetical protein
MRLSFIFPHYLWLLLLLIPIIALDWFGRRRFNPARFWAGLLSRVFLFIALIASIAGIQLYLNSNLMTTVFVLDASDSISAEQHAYGEQIIRETVNQMKKDDRAAVILFGEQALLERLSSEDTNLAEFTSIPITSRTDIANALQLAQAIFPGEGAKRIVLLSDGRENLGKAIEQAELAAASDIELLFFPLGSELTDVEVWVEILDAPAEVRQGQQFDLTVDIRSNANVEAALRVFEDGALIHSRELSLVPGSNRLQIPVNEKKPSTSDTSPGGFRKERPVDSWRLIAGRDRNYQNNG